MTQELSPQPGSALYSPTLDIVTPLSAGALFWRPRYLKESPFLHHLPLLFWLIDVMRPRLAVQLGVGEGVGYFATCQAIDKLNLEARSCGIILPPPGADDAGPEDTREPGGPDAPDPQEGPDAEAWAYHDAHYGDFSQLRRADLHGAARGFGDGTIDLLIVDCAIDEVVLETLLQNWTRKLSERSVVLLHGLSSRFDGTAGRRFIDRLRERHPSIAFEGGEGALLSFFGPEQDERLLRLSRLSVGVAGWSEVQQVFARMGAASYYQWASQSEAERAAAARARLQEVAGALQALEQRHARQQDELARVSRAYDERSRKSGEMQSELHDLHQQRAADAAELERLSARIAAATAEVAARAEELAEMRTRLEQGAQQIARQKSEAAAHFRDLEALTVQLAESGERLQAAQAATAAAEGRAAEAERYNAELLGSTSWKISAPVRWLGRLRHRRSS